MKIIKSIFKKFKKKKPEPKHFFNTSDFVPGGKPMPRKITKATVKTVIGLQYASRENIEKIHDKNFQYLFKKGELPEKVKKVPKFTRIHYNFKNHHSGVILFPMNIGNGIDKEILYFLVLDSLNRLNDSYFVKSIITNDLFKIPPIDPVKDIMESYYYNHIATFAIGNFFTGDYAKNPGDNEIQKPYEYIFNEKSLAVDFNGISYEGIKWLAVDLARKLNQGMLILKTSEYRGIVTFFYKESKTSI